MAGDGPR